MGDRLRTACVQLNARRDKDANLATAERLVADAAAQGAELVVLPEKWNAYGPPDVICAAAEPAGGETYEAMRGWAKRHGIVLIGGSITEARNNGGRLSNTSFVFDEQGELVAAYRKIHMFDVDVDGLAYRESDTEEPGDETIVAQLGGWSVGMSICYDLRFPELYRILALSGAEIVAVPSAFTLFTGQDHWHVLLRARAIENQCFVLAANQWGAHSEDMKTYGCSAIIDPWGVVLAQATDGDVVVVAELDRSRMARVRAELPSLANRQPAAYRWPVEATAPAGDMST